MSIKDLIAAAYNKDAMSFESAFQSIMQDKVAAAVHSAFVPEEVEEELEEAKKSEKDDEEDEDEKDEDEDEEDMKEEAEQIDEISQDTLHNYFAKAAVSRRNARADAERGMNVQRPSGKTISNTAAALKTYRKRTAGLNIAAAKMEEVDQIDRATDKLSK